LELINGTEVTRFPNAPSQWYEVDVTNNIIANNVAGWDGGGVSLQDALKVKFINNTVVSNDTTASAGVLFNTLGAPQASTPPPGCDPTNNPTCIGAAITTSTIQAAGLVTMQNTSNLTAALPANISCPTGNYSGASALNAQCRSISYPLIENDLFWQNRAFNITVGAGPTTGLLNQQNLVTLVPQLNQATTGACVGGANYWDIGVRGDTGPSNHSAYTLNPTYSILTNATGYTGAGVQGGPLANPNLASQYCNGSRVPPENGGMGYAVPPGIADATIPNPLFSLTPAATVDEGNNWINMTYGPLSLTNPTLLPETSLPAPLAPSATSYGNYSLTGTSTSAIATARLADAPPKDFFGTQRSGHADIGAVEYTGAVTLPAGSATLTPTTALTFTTRARNCPGTSPGTRLLCTLDQTHGFTLTNTGTTQLTGIAVTIGGTNPADFTYRPALPLGGACGATLAAGASCTITVQFQPQTSEQPGVKTATVSVVDSAGTQTGTVSGQAT
jgi:hypothetical protein